MDGPLWTGGLVIAGIVLIAAMLYFAWKLRK